MVAYSKLIFSIWLIFCLQFQFLGFETEKKHPVAALRKLTGTTLCPTLSNTLDPLFAQAETVQLSQTGGFTEGPVLNKMIDVTK